MTRAEAATAAGAMRDRNNNQPPSPGIFPDYPAPVVLVGEDGQREMRDMRWGLPSPSWVTLNAAKARAEKHRAKGKDYDWNEPLRMEPDADVTNVRKTEIAHWQQWLGAKNRCLVPMTSFSEPDQGGKSNRFQWFAIDEGRSIKAAGLVLVRQRPSSAEGVMFITVEDETGVANPVVWEKVFEKFRRAVLTSSMLEIDGRVQREGEVVHLIAYKLEDLSPVLASLGQRQAPFPHPSGRADEGRHEPKGSDPRDIYVRDLHIDRLK